MPDYQTRDAQMWVSKLPIPFGTLPAAGAEMEAISSIDVLPGVLPNIEKTDDANRVGTGSEFATHTCNQYWEQPTIGLSNDQDLWNIYGRLWLRAFGGTVVDVVQGTGNAHSAPLRDGRVDGRQLPASAFLYLLGPEDFLLGDMVVDRATLAKSGAAPPTLNFSLVGSGNHQTPNGLTGLPVYVPPQSCADIGSITVKYTRDDAVVVDLSASGCRFKDLVVTVGNNLRVNDRCIGDPLLTQSGGTARYVRRLLYVAPREVGAQFTFLVDTALAEYKLMTANEVVTDVVIAIHGGKIGAGPETYAVGVKIPKATFRNVSAVESDGDAAYSATLQILDDGTQEPATGFVINDLASGFK